MEEQLPVYRVVKSKLFMDQCYAEELDIKRISQEAHFSLYHYIRLFKIIYGITPHQYLRQQRIEKAKRHLSETEMSVTEICFAVGFESMGSFSAMFKSETGLTPRQYRLNCRARQEKIHAQPLIAIPGCLAFKYGLHEK